MKCGKFLRYMYLFISNGMAFLLRVMTGRDSSAGNLIDKGASLTWLMTVSVRTFLLVF